MKRFTKLITLLMAMIFVLSGCYVQKDETTINEDGTVNFVQTVTMEKEKVDNMLKEIGFTDPAKLFSSKDYFSSLIYGDEALEYSEDEEDDVEWKIEKGDDGKEYYKVVTETKYDDVYDLYIDSMNTYDDGLYITTESIYGNVFMDQLFEGAEKIGYEPSSVMKYSVSFTFPKPVINTTGKIDSNNPNKVTFDLDFKKNVTVFATTNASVKVDTLSAKIKDANTIKRPVIKSVKLNKTKGKKASVTLKIKKEKGVEYYVDYSTKKNFGYNYKTKQIKKSKTVIKNLQRGKRYYFRVYAGKKDAMGMPIYSKNSKRKSIYIKKNKKNSKKK